MSLGKRQAEEKRNAKCACKWNMDDKFIEEYCEMHYLKMVAESELAQEFDAFYGESE